MHTEERAHGKVGVLSEPIAAALAYVTFIPAIIFLVLDPYNKNRFVRFHSLQSLLLCGATILLGVVLKLAGLLLFIVPVLGPLLVVVVAALVCLGAVAIWLVLVIKALQGVMFELPWIGPIASQQALRG
jgi:uncharacterized membrane protein